MADLIPADEAKRLLANSHKGPGPSHLKYCQTMVANFRNDDPEGSWQALELFARAPELAAAIIELERQLELLRNYSVPTDDNIGG